MLVEHSHEDIDQYFSCLARFFKKVGAILSLAGLVRAIMDCFRNKTFKPRAVEEVTYTFDWNSLAQEFLDPELAKFDLKEGTGDKVHHFIFEKNQEGKACMQYKVYRQHDPLYPRLANNDAADRSLLLSEKYTCPVTGAKGVIKDIYLLCLLLLTSGMVKVNGYTALCMMRKIFVLKAWLLKTSPSN